jgi:hypothetical protein
MNWFLGLIVIHHQSLRSLQINQDCFPHYFEIWVPPQDVYHPNNFLFWDVLLKMEMTMMTPKAPKV